MKKLKILFQCPRYLPDLGGIQISTQKLADYLIKKGHEISVMCERTSENLKEKENIKGVKVYRYPKLNFHPLMRGFSFLIHQKIIERFCKDFFKKHKFDVIISRFCFFVKPTKKYAKKTPLIYLQPSIAYIASMKMLKSLKGTEKFNRIIKLIIAYVMEKKAMKLADKILTRNKAMVKMNRRLGIEEKKQAIFPQVIDLKRFRPRKNPELKKKLKIESKKVILTVSRIGPEKGLDYVLEIYQKLKTKNVVWLVVGDGNYREVLERKIKELNIKGIYFVGEKKNPENYYNIADVFVLPSEQEGFPNVLLEALACGVPAIAFKANPPKIILPTDELLKKCGFVAKDIEDMARKIDKLLANNKLRRKMGKNAREKAKEYSLEKIGKKFLKIIEEVTE